MTFRIFAFGTAGLAECSASTKPYGPATVEKYASSAVILLYGLVGNGQVGSQPLSRVPHLA